MVRAEAESMAKRTRSPPWLRQRRVRAMRVLIQAQENEPTCERSMATLPWATSTRSESGHGGALPGVPG